MTTVSGVGGVDASTQSASTAARDQLMLDYNAFLQLMMAQMKNQDPTEPVDSTQQLAQLASFSQVEQSIKMNTKLETMLANMSFGQVNDLIGRTVTDAAGTTGIVTTVEVYSDGTILGLDNGKGILLGPGVKIS
ncbi:flagellar hook assembly protein FlgD [Pannonibacter indicus]|uniref:flagellar hook assembly protein FlgD n=1 Tax=Pannonibacter indicus TaxID=466044 RepID=UPI00391C4D80